MVRGHFLLVVAALVAAEMVTLAQAQGYAGGYAAPQPQPVGPAPLAQAPPPPPSGGGYPQVRESHCRYLVNAPSPWGTNASPFKIQTRSYSGEVRRGYPIEVRIRPTYTSFGHFNFTDFALWSEPAFANPAAPPPSGQMQWGGGATGGAPAATPSISHLGVWAVYPKFAGGASSMKCNVFSKGEDTVGSYEGRMLELLQTQFPFDQRLKAFSPSARHEAVFLWYPDENTMRQSGAIKFIAKLQAFGQWFTLESTPWKVHRPPPPRPQIKRKPVDFMATMERTMETMSKMRQMERKMEQASNGRL